MNRTRQTGLGSMPTTLGEERTLFGQSSQGGLIPMAQVRQTQGPLGMVIIP
jgi:hypothetical protein